MKQILGQDDLHIYPKDHRDVALPMKEFPLGAFPDPNEDLDGVFLASEISQLEDIAYAIAYGKAYPFLTLDPVKLMTEIGRALHNFIRRNFHTVLPFVYRFGSIYIYSTADDCMYYAVRVDDVEDCMSTVVDHLVTSDDLNLQYTDTKVNIMHLEK